ncbi:DUF5809 family protein [Halorhabdus amylolytica]|uniref:DUF5809 family protein n=1 Tax=Halorhabdus amylolytica TaxID=2559573 RepID=UPI0010AB4145|nr:DUF5809 family protein [Halorhabdus amylolytica]
MDTEGLFAPETVAEVRERYADLDPAAGTVVREVGRAMGLDGKEYDRLITDDVIATGHDALFASLLAVHVGTREEFETFCADRDAEVVQTGTEHVDGIVWHAPAFTDRIVATTFADAREAAIATLRRQAFGRLYRDVLHETDATQEAPEASDEPPTEGE